MTPAPKLVFGATQSIAQRDQARKDAETKSDWRLSARPIIAAVIAEMQGKPLQEIRTAIAHAYPWGVRANHPYQMWLKEVREQLGTYIDGLKGNDACRKS